jgi:hypothetical protein
MVRDFFITGMKRLFRSILFCTAIMYCGVLTSTAGVKDDRSSPGLIRPESAQDDRPVRIAFFDLDIIAPSSGVQFFRDGIVFLGLSKNYSRMVPEHVSFGTVQAYYAVPGDTSLQNPIIFSPDFRFSWPCDAISFNASYDKMYFTRKDKAAKHEKIYVSDYTGGRNGKGSWSDVSKPLDFCTGDFIYTHPALSGDGNMMIFASDRDGSSGGLDLFITRKTGDKWASPENLGKLINTKSNELYPFLDNSNNLYFSSDGHPGYGGYDIFVSKFNGKKWEEPVNLTKLINSPDDDVAFTLNRLNGKTGFYSSIDNVNKRFAQLYKINSAEKNDGKSPAALSAALLNVALSDTAFTYQKLLLAKADDISRAAEDAKIAEAEATAKAAETKKATSEAKVAETKKISAKEKVAEDKRITEEAKITEAKRLASEAKAAEAKRIADEAKIAEVKRLADEAKAAEKAKAVLASTQPKVRVDTVKSITPVAEKLKDVVVYRVQFLSGVTQKPMNEVIVNGKSYPVYIYYYLKEYRYTAGEFTSLESAKALQSAMRKAGYPQAFVAAFKNNTRSLDLTNFR